MGGQVPGHARGRLDDRYVRAVGDSGRVQWTVAYHDFGAAAGDARYGRELDLELVYRTPWRQQIAINRGALRRRGAFQRYDEGHGVDHLRPSRDPGHQLKGSFGPASGLGSRRERGQE